MERILGTIDEILDIKIIRDRQEKTLQLCQREFIIRMLKRFNMESCNGCSTPCSIKLPEVSKTKSLPDSNTPYQELVGSLLWVSLATRPYICYSVHQLSKYTKNYNNEMWNYGKRVLRYLKQSMNDSLLFSADESNSESTLIGFSDANFGDDKQDRRSTIGYCIYYNNNLVSWSSKKTDSVALSTCEAEFISITKLTQEALYFQQLINELQPESIKQFKIYCDNKSAINLATNSNDHGRSKHIDIKMSFVRDYIKAKTLRLEYLETTNQTADIFTKPLPKEKFLKHKCELNILSKDGDVEFGRDC